jgi:hypothetical protein
MANLSQIAGQYTFQLLDLCGLHAFYYGMTGFACVWYYRKAVLRGGRDLLMKGVLPLLGGCCCSGPSSRRASSTPTPNTETRRCSASAGCSSSVSARWCSVWC